MELATLSIWPIDLGYTTAERFVALLGSLVMIAISVGVHYEALRLLARIGLGRRLPRQAMALIVMALMLVHFIEVGLYASVYYFIDGNAFGHIASTNDDPATFAGQLSDYFYFSAVTYSTLGFGDTVPRGPLRLLAASQSVCGLLLIAWSASFTYLLMQQQWGTPAAKDET